MEEQKKTKKPLIPTRPTFKGDGVAVWEAKREGGKRYLSIKIVGHKTIFANEQ